MLLDQLSSGNHTLHFTGDDGRFYMPYTGTLANVIADLQKAVQENDPAQQFLFAPRFLSGVIDAALAAPSQHAWERKKIACAVHHAIYAGDRAFALQALTCESAWKDYLDNPVEEKLDTIAWRAYNPRHNVQLILNITERFLGYHATLPFTGMLIDGHSGYRSGYFLTAAFGIPTLPIRNSSGSRVQLLPGEENMLATLCRGTVLCYGEDISTGRAISRLGDLAIAYGANIVYAGTLVSDSHLSPVNPFGVQRSFSVPLSGYDSISG